MSERSTRLFAPLQLGALTVRNRLWVSPMCQYTAIDGVPQTWHLTHLTQFASGGAGMVIAEATAVAAEGRISPEDTGLWNDAQATAWAPIAAEIKTRGAVAGVQLAHAGRKASTWSPFSMDTGTVPAAEGGWQTVAPSAIAFGDYAEPRALESGEILRIIENFAAAAKRAIVAGFEVLEIHAAHGYLIHEFLSPLSNQRTDEYGGSLENRARLLLEVIAAVKAAAPGTPIIVRFSGTDWAEGGWDLEQTTTVAQWAEAAGVSLFDISSGGLVDYQAVPVGPAYQAHLAAGLKQSARVPVGSVGLITDAQQAESLLTTGQADFILAGREWLRDPHFALRAASELGESIDYWPVQYERARPRLRG